jgi:hypothetical protein
VRGARYLLFGLLPWVATATVAADLRYDRDYPVIAYSAAPVANEIARLQARLDRSEATLQFSEPRGYLDSLLRALRIDPSSQVLVYSKTSLQFLQIAASTPRAIYFNDDTYIAWVQGSEVLEIATLDAERGAVFYTLRNRQDTPPVMERQTHQCLSCHDTFSMSGGGVPRFLFLSAPVDASGLLPRSRVSIETDDRTPLPQRWGGWYVTGHAGGQAHLGNTVTNAVADLADLDGVFDTRPYLTNRSDVVALLVLEHQLYIKNLITRLNFKTRTFLARERKERWEDASPPIRRALQKMMDGLVDAMVFARAAPLDGTIRGSAGFEPAFARLGPRDSAGRSLRDFDLNTRLFRYPLSYVVYSEGFDALPQATKDYLYRRFATVLANGSQASGKAAVEILRETKPEFARVIAQPEGDHDAIRP